MKLGISLFSSGGIGDLALRANDISMLVANELLPDRADVFKANYPSTTMIVGDIHNKIYEIIDTTKRLLQGRNLDLVFATPPCQGMSKNGRGKLLSQVRKGERSLFDPRNQLIIPTINIIKSLHPETVILENVPEMQDTIIEHKNNHINILQLLKSELSDYVGGWHVVEFADYGIPQRRQRLITVFTRNAFLANHISLNKNFLPAKTNSQDGCLGLKPWRTVRDAIGSLPYLDAKNKKTARHDSLPFHRVPILDSEKYYWVENTPEGKSAFDNQCPYCSFTKNKTHGTLKINGINQSKKDTPLYCTNCGKLLPRPWVKENGEYRIMKGYTSAYKRMEWDLPSPALTRNMSYACSDNKLHPEQNRVLSLHEAFILHTIIDYEYAWKTYTGKKVADKTIRELIGESIPPKGLEKIVTHIFNIVDGKIIQKDIKPKQLSLLHVT